MDNFENLESESPGMVILAETFEKLAETLQQDVE